MYKRQPANPTLKLTDIAAVARVTKAAGVTLIVDNTFLTPCLLYTSDAADERSSVDLGGRRIIKKKTIRRIADHNIDDQTNIEQ